MKKKLFSLVLAFALCLGLAVPAMAADSDFVIENGVLTKYNGSAASVTIPSGVTKIGDSAFYHRNDIRQITIPEGVTEIGASAISGCMELHSLQLPSTLTTIGFGAFSGSNLKSITIPSSASNLENGIFSNCYLLTDVVFSDGATKIGIGMFWGCDNLSNVTIPASVTSIGEDAFDLCDKMTIHGAAGSYAETYAKANNIPFVASLPAVGTDTNAAFDKQYSIPGLEEYVIFSNPYVGTDKDTAVVDISTDTNGETQIKREEITIYEFPVGTKLRLTEKALKDGYTILHIDTSAVDDSELFQTELTLSKVTTWRDKYSVYSENDPTGFTIFLRAVNTDVAFSDVKSGAYYQDAVQWAVKYGVTSGTSATTFSPAQTCTVAQIITFLWRAKGCSEPYIPNPFNDVSEGDYYYKAALWAEGYGVVDGNQFNPNAPCTRSMVVTYLWKMNGSPSATPSNFTDVPANADYAQAVAWAVEKGITAGSSATTFSPASTCTRGQIVTFLYRAFGK